LGEREPRREFLYGLVVARAGKGSFDFAGMFASEHSFFAQDDKWWGRKALRARS
jgi:hypothetical protein